MSQINKSRQKRERNKDEETITDEQINSAVRSILIFDQTKRPIKKTDVLHSLADVPPRKMHNDFWDKVKIKMSDIGFLLKLDPHGQKTMLLVSNERDKPFMLDFASEDEKADRTLLVIILSYIFMKEEQLTSEVELFRFLCKLQILTEQSANHEYFGDVKKKVQGEFADKLYLDRTTFPDNELVEVRWGPRAEVELLMLDILKFVCKVGYSGRQNPEEFKAQFKKAEEQEVDEEGEEDESEEEEEVTEEDD